MARDIRAAGAKAGISVKPGTPLEPYLDILPHFDTLLVMSVEPGFGGQRFIPEVLSKVRAVRKMVDAGELTILVEIDGGINDDTIEQAAEAASTALSPDRRCTAPMTRPRRLRHYGDRPVPPHST